MKHACWYRWKRNVKRLLPGACCGSFVDGWVKKRQRNTTEMSFSIQKGHENLYKYQEDLVIQGSICKKGTKEGQTHRWWDVPGCHDVCSVSCRHRYYIRRHFTGHHKLSSYKSSNDVTSFSLCYLKWWQII